MRICYFGAIKMGLLLVVQVVFVGWAEDEGLDAPGQASEVLQAARRSPEIYGMVSYKHLLLGKTAYSKL